MDLDQAASARDILDAVVWSYRLILGREELDQDLIRQHVGSCRTIAQVRQSFWSSDEFHGRSSQDDRDIFDAFPSPALHSEAGFFHDFLGTRTRCSYLPDSLGHLSGKVHGRPGSNDGELHEKSEWIGTLRSVLDAKQRGRLVVAELGAGWGPWLVIAARAAASLAIPHVTLVGVEGSKEHLQFMQQHFVDNGIDPAAHGLMHAVVAKADGVALFPILDAPNEDWGAKALSGDTANVRSGYEQVPAVSLESLFKDKPPFDLVHCDIQGAEAEVLTAAADVLKARVRRIVIGTHGRDIESQLLDVFARNGWRLEHEQPCKYFQADDGSISLLADGAQVWRNSADIAE